MLTGRAFMRLSALALMAAALTGCFDTQSSDRTAKPSARTSTFPALSGRIVDEAGILHPGQVIDLSAKSEALEAATKRQFVIVTVKSLNGRDVATYTRDLGNHWGIGDANRDDGVILLVAPNEKKARIAVGSGLEQTFTDEKAKAIMEKAILPRFRDGDLSGGISSGADAIVAQLSAPPK